MLYTTYFGNMKNLPEKCIKLNITRFSPKWLDSSEYPPILALSPSEPLLIGYKNGLFDFNTFSIEFSIQVLSDSNEVLVNLGKASQTMDIAIICYEKDNNQCHRRLIAEWLEKYYGIEWKEI